MRRQWFGQESSLGSYCQLRVRSVSTVPLIELAVPLVVLEVLYCAAFLAMGPPLWFGWYFTLTFAFSYHRTSKGLRLQRCSFWFCIVFMVMSSSLVFKLPLIVHRSKYGKVFCIFKISGVLDEPKQLIDGQWRLPSWVGIESNVGAGRPTPSLLALTFSCLKWTLLLWFCCKCCAVQPAVWSPFVIWLIVHTHICFVLLQDQQGTPSQMMELLFFPQKFEVLSAGVTEDVTGKEENK